MGGGTRGQHSDGGLLGSKGAKSSGERLTESF